MAEARKGPRGLVVVVVVVVEAGDGGQKREFLMTRPSRLSLTVTIAARALLGTVCRT